MSFRKDNEISCEALQAAANQSGWSCLFDDHGDRWKLWAFKNKAMTHGWYVEMLNETGKALVKVLPIRTKAKGVEMTVEEACCVVMERMEEGRAA